MAKRASRKSSVRGVRRKVRTSSPPKTPVALSLSPAPGTVGGGAQSKKATPEVPPPAPSRIERAEGSKAIRKVLDLKTIGGRRIGLLGHTGMGKSHAERKLIAHLAHEADFVLILDDARDQQYQGEVRVNAADFQARLSEMTGRVAVFRGKPRAQPPVKVDAAEIFELAFRMARTEQPVESILIVIDEMRRATTPSGREWVDDLKLPGEGFCEGRKIGISIMWATNSPKRVPDDAIDETDSLLIFQVDGRALNYFDHILTFDGDMMDQLPTLQFGEFVLWQRAQPWDRTVYKFDS